MSAPLSQLLEHVLEGEPPAGDEVDAVFRRADRLRRRRTQGILGAGAVTAAIIVALGYVLTSTLLAPRPATIKAVPATPGLGAVSPPLVPSQAPVPGPSAPDGVLEVIEPLVEGRELRVVPGSAERGDGWRRYEVAEPDGRSRGTVEVAVFDVRKKWCFPVAADPDECARPDRAAGLEFVRYDDVSDADRQVRQTIAHRLDDGRTVAVMALGKRDAGAQRGKPGLTGAQVEQVATDERVFDAFGRKEDCGKGCPDFNTPVESSPAEKD
ncbi:hypothetical protein Aab01nite_38190 [Paractinoplanes abujensis]|uniref:Uncharacterized protein n=1 Tax=Paractinoplanes abujensis TaxID=882441 RepID=A0A7W7CTS4_9ACTN|nr:hypothetical protein [Actinoplanes abujensis]MBB4694557.1 hypothetical protein [Actinoplanes abujensis]GID20229.1 hypothetical protein Aab01nite_38190 [Actinoplanes abujensis]